MSSQKILMLWPVKEDYWPRNISKLNLVTIDSMFKKQNFIGNIIRKICVLNGWFLNKFLSDWIKEYKNYDVIIVQASSVTKHIPKYLRKLNYKGRIIYWYWDPVSGSVNPNKIDRNDCEIWSFDIEDCKKFNLKFNNTYYVYDKEDYLNLRNKNDEIYDVCYIGRDKGRLRYLKEIELKLKNQGLKTFFYIVATKPYSLSAKKLNPAIDYLEVLDIVSKSKAILDINQKDQSGLSMRCMESIFLNKKLITNNKFVLGNPLFKDDNVFIIDHDRDLKSFLNKENKSLPNDIDIYSFENWLKALLQGKE